MVLRLFLFSAASEALYFLLARVSREPPAEGPFASSYLPLRVEETVTFLGLWAGLFLVYSLAIRETSKRKGRSLFLFIFLTSALFRGSLLWESRFPGGGPSAFLQSSSPMARVATELEDRISNVAWAKPILLRGGRSTFVRACVASAFDMASLALAPGLLRALGLPAGLVLVQGWNPLLVKEVSGDGRVEAIALFLLVLSFRLAQRGRMTLAAFAYGASLTGPPVLWVTFPLLARALRFRIAWSLLPAAVAWGLASLSTPFRDLVGWPPQNTLGGSVMPCLDAINRLLLTRNPWVALTICAVLWLSIGAVRTAKLRTDLSNLPSEALLLMGSFLFLAPQVLPWSFLTVATFAAYSTNPGWLVATATSTLTYFGFTEGGWNFWLGFTQYFPAYVSLVYTWLGEKRE